MRVGLHDAERDYLKHKRFPNYALMKISAYHKARGDSVEWWDPITSHTFDLIYSSKIFDFTPENPYLPPSAIRGGTGYPDIPINQTLPPEIDAAFPDYSIYPECDYAIGYITRGCPNRCPWCVVPAKEGGIKPYRAWEQIVRPDTKKLVLMDNNILASEYGILQLESLIGTGYEIDLNQGMDARLVTDRIAGILARLKWIRFIRFSCDQIPQIEAIERAAELLEGYGKKPYNLFIYLLVTKDVENAAYRVERLKRLKGISIYAQAERNDRKGIIPKALQKEFAQRFVYGRCYLKESWEEYLTRHKEKRLQNEKVSTREEARQLAMKRLRQKNKSEYKASFTLTGDTRLVAGVTVEVSGYGAFDGKYIIETATHSVSKSGGYKTDITLRRVLEGY